MSEEAKVDGGGTATASATAEVTTAPSLGGSNTNDNTNTNTNTNGNINTNGNGNGNGNGSGNGNPRRRPPARTELPVPRALHSLGYDPVGVDSLVSVDVSGLNAVLNGLISHTLRSAAQARASSGGAPAVGGEDLGRDQALLIEHLEDRIARLESQGSRNSGGGDLLRRLERLEARVDTQAALSGTGFQPSSGTDGGNDKGNSGPSDGRLSAAVAALSKEVGSLSAEVRPVRSLQREVAALRDEVEAIGDRATVLPGEHAPSGEVADGDFAALEKYTKRYCAVLEKDLKSLRKATKDHLDQLDEAQRDMQAALQRSRTAEAELRGEIEAARGAMKNHTDDRCDELTRALKDLEDAVAALEEAVATGDGKIRPSVSSLRLSDQAAEKESGVRRNGSQKSLHDRLGQPPTVEVDAKGVVTLWNASMSRETGIPADEAVGKPLAGSLCAPWDRAEVEAWTGQAMLGNVTATLDVPILSHTGRVTRVLLEGSPKFTKAGRLAGAVFSPPSDGRTVAVLAVDLRERVTQWSALAAVVTGIPPPRALGAPLGMLLQSAPKHALDALFAALRRATRDDQSTMGAALPLPTALSNSSGDSALTGSETSSHVSASLSGSSPLVHHLRCCVYPSTGEEGVRVGAHLSCTERASKRALAAIGNEYSMATFGSFDPPAETGVQGHMQNPLFVVNGAGVISEWSIQASAVTGVPRSAAVGKRLANIGAVSGLPVGTIGSARRTHSGAKIDTPGGATPYSVNALRAEEAFKVALAGGEGIVRLDPLHLCIGNGGDPSLVPREWFEHQSQHLSTNGKTTGSSTNINNNNNNGGGEGEEEQTTAPNVASRTESAASTGSATRTESGVAADEALRRQRDAKRLAERTVAAMSFNHPMLVALVPQRRALNQSQAGTAADNGGDEIIGVVGVPLGSHRTESALLGTLLVELSILEAKLASHGSSKADWSRVAEALGSKLDTSAFDTARADAQSARAKADHCATQIEGPVAGQIANLQKEVSALLATVAEAQEGGLMGLGGIGGGGGGDLDGAAAGALKRAIASLDARHRELEDILAHKADRSYIDTLKRQLEETSSSLTQLRNRVKAELLNEEHSADRNEKMVALITEMLLPVRQQLIDYEESIQYLTKEKASWSAVEGMLEVKADAADLGMKANITYVEALFDRLNNVLQSELARLNSDEKDNEGKLLEHLHEVTAALEGKVDRNEILRLERHLTTLDHTTKLLAEDDAAIFHRPARNVACLTCDRFLPQISPRQQPSIPSLGMPPAETQIGAEVAFKRYMFRDTTAPPPPGTPPGTPNGGRSSSINNNNNSNSIVGGNGSNAAAASANGAMSRTHPAGQFSSVVSTGAKPVAGPPPPGSAGRNAQSRHTHRRTFQVHQEGSAQGEAGRESSPLSKQRGAGKTTATGVTTASQPGLA